MLVLIQFEKKPLLFQNPKYIISCADASSFSACFLEIEQALKAGYYLAGFFSYEAGYCFEERLRENKVYDFPLIHLGVYEYPLPNKISRKNQTPKNNLKDIRLNILQDDYSLNIQTIRDYIEKGDVYQITYCIKLLFEFFK